VQRQFGQGVSPAPTNSMTQEEGEWRGKIISPHWISFRRISSARGLFHTCHSQPPREGGA